MMPPSPPLDPESLSPPPSLPPLPLPLLLFPPPAAALAALDLSDSVEFSPSSSPSCASCAARASSGVGGGLRWDTTGERRNGRGVCLFALLRRQRGSGVVALFVGSLRSGHAGWQAKLSIFLPPRETPQSVVLESRRVDLSKTVGVPATVTLACLGCSPARFARQQMESESYNGATAAGQRWQQPRFRPRPSCDYSSERVANADRVKRPQSQPSELTSAKGSRSARSLRSTRRPGAGPRPKGSRTWKERGPGKSSGRAGRPPQSKERAEVPGSFRACEDQQSHGRSLLLSRPVEEAR